MKAPLLALLASAAILAGGCGREDPSTPVACLDGPEPVLAALGAAPDPVRLADGTRISECLTDNQPGGQLAQAGDGLISAATDLNDEAFRDPGGQANLALGYLLGAARQGAEETGGIHADLIRRLEASVYFRPGGGDLPRSIEESLMQGIEAGTRHG